MLMLVMLMLIVLMMLRSDDRAADAHVLMFLQSDVVDADVSGANDVCGVLVNCGRRFGGLLDVSWMSLGGLLELSWQPLVGLVEVSWKSIDADVGDSDADRADDVEV